MDFTPGLAAEEGTLTALQEEDEIEDDSYEGVKKRLFDCGDLETPVIKTKKQPVLVYLRIRPKSHIEILNKDPNCLHTSGEQELLAVAPKSSQTYKNKLGARCIQEGTQKFTFTRIFPPLTTQKELFDDTLRLTLKDFFDGQNCLLFTYGVTNSGKTYTVTGPPSDPGILPRSLDVIFNSIDHQQLSSVSVKPKHFSEVVYLSKDEATEMESHKENTLNMARELMANHGQLPQQQEMSESAVGDETEVMEEHDISSVSTISKASSNLTDIDGGSFAEFLHDESSIELDAPGNQQFSIWVSFAEIYNEFIYDLLTEPPAKGKLRTALKISEDRNRNHFIKGLQEYQVSSVDEAMLLLRLGLQHRHVAHTKLNYNSSRSHSIYTIKLIRLVNVDKPSRALVNRISVVDLAGAERSAKTGATGMRIKEAGNINNSLLTLGKCIEAMRYNQVKRGSEERVVPFRESKLTRLFQNYFVGSGKGKSLRQGKITMFVNVSNNASVFDETVHVLKFSALTSKIVPTTKIMHSLYPASTSTCPPPLPTSHQPPTITSLTAVRTAGKTNKHAKIAQKEKETAPMILESNDNLPSSTSNLTQCMNCKYLNGQLSLCMEEAKAKMSELQVKLIEQEYNIRQEVSQEFSEQLTDIEDKHIRDLEEQAEEYEVMYGQRMKLLQQSVKKANSRKRRRQDDDDADVSDQSLKVEVANLKERVHELEEELAMEKNRASAEIHDAMESYESKVVMLNKQLADMAIQLSTSEKKFSSERHNLEEQLQAAEGRVAQPSAEREQEREKFKLQCQEYEEMIIQLRQRSSEMERELEEARRVQVSLSVAAEEGQRDETMELEREKNEIMKQLSSAERKNADLAQQASDALAEEEILQARISELTNENTSIDAAKCELLVKVQELMAEKEANEITNAELLQERQLFNEKETELVGLRTKAETQSKEISLLEGMVMSLRKELNSSLARADELTSQKATIEAERSELESRLQEFATERKESGINVMDELQREKNISNKKDEDLASLSDKLKEQQILSDQKDKDLVALTDRLNQEKTLSDKKDKELATLRAEAEHKVREIEDKCMVLRDELNSSLAKAAVKQEAIYKVEEAKESLEKEVSALLVELKAKKEENGLLNKELSNLKALVDELNEKNSLCSSFAKTLKEYETTLEKQSTYIREVEEEKENVHTLNEELLQKVDEMARQLAKATSSRDNLHIKNQELTEALEDSRCKLTRREAELLDSADKVRGTMENQLSDLRKQSASLEHDVTSAREDNKLLQQQLREKESELLNLAKGVNVEKTALTSVRQELEEARQLVEQRQSQLDAMQGNHQLEVAQLNIKLREVVSELEEVRFVCSQHHIIPGSSSTEGDEQEQHIYEEPPLEDSSDHEEPVYDTVEDVVGQPLASLDNKPSAARRSYLQAVEGREDTSAVREDLDKSKPHVPVLERSSLLIEDSVLDESTKMEIDATPLPLRKKGRKLKAKAAKTAQKRKIEDKENDPHEGSPLAKKPRSQRTRQKPQRFEEETSSMDNFTPTSQKNHRSLRQRLLGTGKAKKAKAVEQTTPAQQEEKGGDCIASRTRQRGRVLTKSQISGPLELRESPKGSRIALESKGSAQLGSRMRPVSNC